MADRAFKFANDVYPGSSVRKNILTYIREVSESRNFHFSPFRVTKHYPEGTTEESLLSSSASRENKGRRFVSFNDVYPGSSVRKNISTYIREVSEGRNFRFRRLGLQNTTLRVQQREVSLLSSVSGGNKGRRVVNFLKKIITPRETSVWGYFE